MRTKVQTVPLASEVSFLSGGTPRMSDSRFWGGDIPWVSSGEMTESRISLTERRVTEEGAQNGTKRVPANTVLVVVRGMSLAKEFRISITERDVTFNQDIKALRPSERIDPWFLFYYLKSQRHSIRDSATDASHGTKKLETRVLEQWPLPLLDIQTQRFIASVLSTYDNLIENNRRRIQLMEQAARLLYKEWFVHLRFPGHEHVKIVDGVPEGWEKKNAFDVIDVLSGGTPKTTNPSFWNGDIPFFTPKDATDFAYAHDTEKSITEAGLKNCNSKLYPKGTVFITARGTVGKINLAQRPMAMNQSCYALVAHPPLNQQFLFFALVDGVEQFRSRAVGAVFDAIVRDTFKLIPFVVPEEKLISAFMGHVSPMLAQVDNLSGQVRSLRKARDLLLPKLMNGEIAV
ncbi:restriction endonuclease subunit S [Desulfonatronum parangueonense]